MSFDCFGVSWDILYVSNGRLSMSYCHLNMLYGHISVFGHTAGVSFGSLGASLCSRDIRYPIAILVSPGGVLVYLFDSLGSLDLILECCLTVLACSCIVLGCFCFSSGVWYCRGMFHV